MEERWKIVKSYLFYRYFLSLIFFAKLLKYLLYCYTNVSNKVQLPLLMGRYLVTWADIDIHVLNLNRKFYEFS